MSSNQTVLKKKGRKTKKELAMEAELEAQSKIEAPAPATETEEKAETTNIVPELSQPCSQDAGAGADPNPDPDPEIEPLKPITKKRGRKPKGGKIVQQLTSANATQEPKTNVILHLKCSLKDLQNSLINTNIQSYDFNANTNLEYDFLNSQMATMVNSINNTVVDNYDEDDYKENDTKDVCRKLKQLEHNLHVNNICDKKSACFWCTYDFDNPPIYIPKYHLRDTYHVYGCFCSPECATAHLMEENIDSSVKFERYYLLNHIYSKIYDYKKNIKPAPNPYYMLEKFYGNLSIQEYRSLLKNERLFLIVDKPLTRIMPELHEDNDDFIINNKIIPSNTFQIKKKMQNRQTKNNIVTERFGMPSASISATM